MDEALLQRMREQSGLRLDREGRFWHQDTPVEHERTHQVLLQGVHRAPDGRWATRIGREWGYLDVEDTARFVRRLEPGEAPGTLHAWLTDGSEASIDPGTLALGAGGALYVRTHDGERARLTRAAQAGLADLLREHDGQVTLELHGVQCAIGVDTGPEPRRAPGPPGAAPR